MAECQSQEVLIPICKFKFRRCQSITREELFRKCEHKKSFFENANTKKCSFENGTQEVIRSSGAVFNLPISLMLFDRRSMMSCVQTMRFLAAFLTFILASGEPLPSERIINGINAQNGRYPYSVSLQRGNYHICGGSLIGKCGVW